MLLHTSCQLKFEIALPTPFVLMLRPRSGIQQWVASEEYKISPTVPVVEFTDDFGNLCQRLIATPGIFSIYTAAKVTTADKIDVQAGADFVEIQKLPDNVFKFLLPSRYCESDRFGEMANEITLDTKPGYDQVAAIEQWLRKSIAYKPGSSNSSLSAVEINLQQEGVCRDLAHLGIALCRSISIPARMVVGYLYGLVPMEMHAWFEAYIGGRWYTFDATQGKKKGGYVALGFGRDAADVAVYNQFGPPVFPLEQTVKVKRLREKRE